MTIRQRLFDAVVSQLRSINTDTPFSVYGVTGNYQSDLGSRVWPWRSAPFTDPSQLPALVVRDIDEIHKLSSNGSARMERELHMQVNIVVAGDGAMNDLRDKYFPDVETAILVGSRTVWGDYTSNTRPRLNRTVFDHESQALAGGIVEFYIDYPTFTFYPYEVTH